MQSTVNRQLFTEMTAEEAAAINGGGWVTVMKVMKVAGKVIPIISIVYELAKDAFSSASCKK
jgi:hypothetical protein